MPKKGPNVASGLIKVDAKVNLAQTKALILTDPFNF